MRAIKAVFPSPQSLNISSTKALTGHGLSLSSIMEAAFCCLAIQNKFMPGSANVSNPDPELGHLNLLRKTKFTEVSKIMSNSSGFGGANVSLILEKV